MTYGLGSEQLAAGESTHGLAHAVPAGAQLLDDATALCGTTVRVARGTWPPREGSRITEPCNVCAELAGH